MEEDFIYEDRDTGLLLDYIPAPKIKKSKLVQESLPAEKYNDKQKDNERLFRLIKNSVPRINRDFVVIRPIDSKYYYRLCDKLPCSISYLGTYYEASSHPVNVDSAIIETIILFKGESIVVLVNNDDLAT